MSSIRSYWPSVIRLIACGCIAATLACAKQTAPAVRMASPALSEQLVFLTRERCVNTGIMRANVDAALRTLGMRADYQVVDLATLADTDPRRGYPTPTLLYENRDVFGMPEPPIPHPPAT